MLSIEELVDQAKTGKLIDQTKGVVSNEIFSEEIYQRELENVFGKCWLFVGHESMIPNNGDYISNFMGEDPIIVRRDQKGKVRVFLNKCRHRGNKVCLFDKGNTSTFTCSYHGWAYDTEGKLKGVPFFEESYYGELDRDEWGLIEVPKVATYGGLIFACWDAGVMPLEEYLGDLRWYLDNFLLLEDMGGIEIIPGKHKYMMPVNWKLLAENFAGDDYHFLVTHASLLKALSIRENAKLRSSLGSGMGGRKKEGGREYSVAVGYGDGVPHGLLELKIGEKFYQEDLDQAESLGEEAVDWVKKRYRRLQERLHDMPVKPYSFHVGTIFPNFSLIGVSTTNYANGLISWHPRGPYETEVWQWCAVDKGAPMVLKKRQNFVLMQRQAAAGLVAPDDHENFERLTKNIRAPVASKFPFNYQMGMGHEEDELPGLEGGQDEELPGLIAPQITEVPQREFYRYWGELMDKEDKE